MKELYNQFELHYFFDDESHGISATVRNDCERELLNLFEEAANSLELKVRVESKPPQNGGFVEIWEFVGANKELITLALTALSLIMSRVPVQNRKLTKLQIENLELDNLLKREELRKLGLANLDQADEQMITKIINYLMKNYRIVWRRSNFFKKMRQYPRIIKITINKLRNYIPAPEPVTLDAQEFSDFVLVDETIPDITGQVEEIDLISSALKHGKFRWKGFLNNQIVDFEMLDEPFKQQVFQGNIEHTNKVKLKVELNHARKIDDTGKIKVTRYYVSKVLSYSINGIEHHRS